MCRDVMDDVFGFDDSTRSDNERAAAAAAAKAAADKAAADAAAAAAVQQPVAQQPVAQQPAAQQPTAAVPAFDTNPFKSQIDTGFSMFTPEFYANKYAEIYNPYRQGVETQYGAARDALTAGLANKGLADSQQGRNTFQQLDALRDQAFNTGQTAAQGFQTSLQNKVNAAKNSLYGGLGATADNAGIVSKAPTEAQKIAGTATPVSTLGDVFGEFTRPYTGGRNPGGPVNPELQAFATGGNLNLAGGGGGPQASTSVVGNKKKKF